MRQIQQIQRNLAASTTALLLVLQELPADNFNTRPAPDHWSAAEIVEHIIILEELIARVMTGPAAQAGRDPEEKIGEIQAVFMDNSRPLSAPEAIAPSGAHSEGITAGVRLQVGRQRLVEILHTHDPAGLCTSFAHRLFGELTRVEWAYFAIWHAERHLRQLQKLLIN